MFIPRRRPSFRPIVAVALLALALALSACAAHKPTQSGFLTAAPRVSAQGYSAALIDVVDYRPVGRTPGKGNPADVDALKADYHAALAAAFAAHYRLTDTPGPDVLRVRAAITGYTLANPAWNAVSLALPIGPKNGGISIEAEVVDARSGAPIVAQSEGFNGHIWNSAPTAMFDRDGHAQSGFRKHAQALVDATLAAAR